MASLRLMLLLLLLAALVASTRADREAEDEDDEFEGSEGGFAAARPKRGKKRKKSGRPFTIMHSFDGETFLPRARVELFSSKLSQHRVVKFIEPGVMLKQELASFKELVKSGGFYRVRVLADAATASPTKAADGEDVPYVVASISACQLLLHDFEEQLLFHMDDSNNIVSAEYTNAYVPDNDGECLHAQLPERRRRQKRFEFQSTATVFMPLEAAPIPLRVQGNPFVPGAKKVDKDGKAIEKKPQPGFFRRYWYIIVPVGLLMLLSSAIDPAAMEEAQRRAQTAQRQQ